MGTSASRGGGGSGGSGGGSGGGGRYESQQEAEEKQARGERSTAQEVLARTQGQYLLMQLAGPMVRNLVRSLVLLGVEFEQNRRWASMCKRLELHSSASLANICDKILETALALETDVRARQVSEVALRLFFDELADFDDELLDEPGSNALMEDLRGELFEKTLEKFMALLIQQVLQREEPQILNASSHDGLVSQSEERARRLAAGLRNKYVGNGRATEASYLDLAVADEKGRAWLLRRLRN